MQNTRNQEQNRLTVCHHSLILLAGLAPLFYSLFVILLPGFQSASVSASVSASESLFFASKSLKTTVSTKSYIDFEGNTALTNQRFYLRQEASSLIYKKKYGLSLYSNFSVELDSEERFQESDEHYQVVIDSLYAEWQKGFLRFTIGMQQLNWGETFGIPIADVVNPLDHTHPFTSDLSDLKLAVPLASLELITGNFYAQALYNPWARRSPLPSEIENIKIANPSDFEPFQDSEFGGRVGYLFGFGLDLKALYYQHYSRIPRYQLELSKVTSVPELVLVESKQESIGISASQAFELVVLRLDSIFENGFLLRNNLSTLSPEEALAQKVQVSKKNQTIAALDYTTNNGDNFGIQYQTEFFTELPESEMGLHPRLQWVGARSSLSFLGSDLIFDLFAIKGLENDDFWVRPQLRSFLGNRTELSIEANFMQSSGNGNTDIYSDRKLGNAGISYRF